MGADAGTDAQISFSQHRVAEFKGHSGRILQLMVLGDQLFSLGRDNRLLVRSIGESRTPAIDITFAEGFTATCVAHPGAVPSLQAMIGHCTQFIDRQVPLSSYVRVSFQTTQGTWQLAASSPKFIYSCQGVVRCCLQYDAAPQFAEETCACLLQHQAIAALLTCSRCNCLRADTYLNKVVVGGQDGRLQLWNFATKTMLYEFAGWGSAVQCTTPSPALDVVGVGLADGRAVLHNLRFDETVVTFANAAGLGASDDLLLSGTGRGNSAVGGNACSRISFRTGSSFTHSNHVYHFSKI